jgi:cytochrome c556
LENFIIKILEAGIPLAVVAFFIRHWMTLVEDRARTNAMRIEENDQRTRQHLAQVTDKTSREIKEAIHENREEYRLHSTNIKESIDKLSDHVATQNGRVSKIEAELREQVAACKVRQLQHRKDD